MIKLSTNKFGKYCRTLLVISGFIGFFIVQGCTSVTSFPTVARAGDTVSVMIGGSENARKESIAVTLTDANNINWNLQELARVRSVFNLRADGRAIGTHYSSFLESYVSWSEGHEPVQTVLVIDIPTGVSVGNALLTVDPMVNDDSSGIAPPFSINIEIIPGIGNSDDFMRQDAIAQSKPVDFSRLEPAPNAKISFGISSGVVIGAASLVIDFDETVVAPGDINVYVPESNVRGSYVSTGSFGNKQRMVYWYQDGHQLFLDMVAPQGINQAYLMAYIIHPDSVVGSPAFNITSSKIYDVNGNEIVLTPTLEYHP